MPTSVSSVKTDHASRYLQQLCKHWSHRFTVEFNETAGKVPFSPETSVEFTADASALLMTSARRKSAGSRADAECGGRPPQAVRFPRRTRRGLDCGCKQGIGLLRIPPKVSRPVRSQRPAATTSLRWKEPYDIQQFPRIAISDRPSFPRPLVAARLSPTKPMPEADLLTMLEAGHWAPSSSNSQPWRFVYALRGSENWDKFPRASGRIQPGLGEIRLCPRHFVVSSTHFGELGSAEQKPNYSHCFDTGTAWGFLAIRRSCSASRRMA